MFLCKYSHVLNRFVVYGPSTYGPKIIWIGTQKFSWFGQKMIHGPVGWRR